METQFPLCKSTEAFNALRTVNSVVRGPIYPKCELIQGITHFLVTCKLQKEQINRNREKCEDIDVLEAQGQLTL